jgi:lysozyme
MSATIAEPIAAPTDHDIALAIGARLVAQCEGCKLAPYQDNGRGVWTIGVGTISIDGAPVTADTPPITQDEAYALMEAELASTAALVDDMIVVPVTVSARCALYSFAYNEGTNALRTSTLLRLLNSAAPMSDVAAQFASWVYAGGKLDRGLVNRRALERAVFLGQTSI